VAALVLEYYVLLRSVLRTKPLLRRCRVHCRHCGIFFLTHPGNGGRKDLGCPFGCRLAHRRRQSTLRSVAYYRDPTGKRKKRDLNQKRRRPMVGGQAPGVSPASAPVPESGGAPSNRLMLAYIQMVVSLMEGRRVSRTEILEMLRRFLRQHSLGRRSTIDHTVAWLHEYPP
jgi:hypothetical protein